MRGKRNAASGVRGPNPEAQHLLRPTGYATSFGSRHRPFVRALNQGSWVEGAPQVPYRTPLINVTGSFLLGFFVRAAMYVTLSVLGSVGAVLPGFILAKALS